MLRKENCKVNDTLLSNFQVEVSKVKAVVLKTQLVCTSTVGSSSISQKVVRFLLQQMA